jgi:hypothetical protein
MFSRDAYEMRDYEAEDFKSKSSGPLQAVGDYLLDREDVMGVADKHWNDKYGDFFDQGEDEDRNAVVRIPRYQGPQNTRVDVIPLVSNQFDVSGIPNHSQSSCVYLKQSFKFAITSRNYNVGLQNNYLTRPFTIQRQFQKLYWTAPQCARQLDTNIQQQVRLAPYLCDAQKLANCTNYQVTMQLVSNAQPLKWVFNYTLFEPLLGFQSGYKLLDSARPYNQQVMKYPLAIQDYQLNIQKYARISDTVKRCLRDSRCVNASQVENYQDTFVREPAQVDTNVTARANTYFDSLEISDPELVSYSNDSSLQDNKGVSTVSLHAPVMEVYTTPVVINVFDLNGDQYTPANPQAGTPAIFTPGNDIDYINNSTGLGNPFALPRNYILGIDAGTNKTVIKCNTSKGFPSYIMVYLEDFGNDYFDKDFANSVANDIGTDMIIGGQPMITALEIRVFGQPFPVTKQLNKEELEYITKKNCHPRCDFNGNMKYDPIVLLKLEDLGLATESVGYPSAKRLELEVEIKQIVLPRHYNWRSYTYGQPAPPMRAYAAFVYENHVLEGNNNRMDFVWK